MNDVAMWHNFTRAQDAMVRATMPTAGVIEYDDTPILSRVKPEDLTGPARRANLALLTVKQNRSH